MSDTSPDAKAIFFAALEHSSPDNLAEFLDRECGDNAELRGRVEDLLRAHQKAGNFLGGSMPAGETVDVPQITEKPGTQIGPYKLRQQIASGGMGVVYVAEQKEPVKRRVALKIIKPGMDSQQVIARFEAERQALALMDHPNIAKVLDAGTTDSGRPYFVMELVNGLPITEYCDQQHLTPRERLELFVPICHAVQHAHQKGIIHRDLKPSNILVALYDGRPVPKVIDFGVAKATSQTLTEKSIFTHFGQIVGTLDYMSPEQAERNQLDIDTRSDIYSLGVVLYELLTGDTPFDRERLRSAAFDEMLRIIREEEPPKPSTKLSSSESLPAVAANRKIEPARLGSLVRGELDWIVLKALEKDRVRRYETANGFAADIQRYLEDEPVIACPPSRAYRLRKFARRNKTLLATSGLVALALIAGILGTSLQAIRASKERNRAVAAEKLAKQHLENEQHQRARAEQAEQLSKQEAQRAAEEAKRADAEAKKARNEAATARAVNDFLNNDLLGMADAESLIQSRLTPDPDVRLRTILDRAAKGIGGRFTDQPLVEARLRDTIGLTYRKLGLADAAQTHHQRALDLRRKSLGEEHPETLESMHLLAIAHLASRLPFQRLKAIQMLERILEHQKEILGEAHASTLSTTTNLASAYRATGKVAQAINLLQEVLPAIEKANGREAPDTLKVRGNLAVAYLAAGKNAEGLKQLEELLPLMQKVRGKEHPDTLMAMNNLAQAYMRTDKYEQATPLFEKTLKLKEQILGETHPATFGSRRSLVDSYLKVGRYERAVEVGERQFSLSKDKYGENHIHTSRPRKALQLAYFEVKDYVKAIKLLEGSISQGKYSPDDKHVQALAFLATDDGEGYRRTLVRMKTELDQSPRGFMQSRARFCLVWTRALQPISSEQRDSAMKTAELLSQPKASDSDRISYAATLFRSGKVAEAIELLDKLHQSWEAAEKKPRLHQYYSPAYVWYFLAMAHHKQGDDEKARKWLGLANKFVEAESGDGKRYVLYVRRLTYKFLRKEVEQLLSSSK